MMLETLQAKTKVTIDGIKVDPSFSEPMARCMLMLAAVMTTPRAVEAYALRLVSH